MKYVIIATMLLVSSPVFAQSKEYTIKLTTNEINQIGTLLGTQPYKDVAALIANLLAQVAAQDKEVKK